jgi:hypothetical protein
MGGDIEAEPLCKGRFHDGACHDVMRCLLEGCRQPCGMLRSVIMRTIVLPAEDLIQSFSAMDGWHRTNGLRVVAAHCRRLRPVTIARMRFSPCQMFIARTAAMCTTIRPSVSEASASWGLFQPPCRSVCVGGHEPPAGAGGRENSDEGKDHHACKGIVAGEP